VAPLITEWVKVDDCRMAGMNSWGSSVSVSKSDGTGTAIELMVDLGECATSGSLNLSE